MLYSTLRAEVLISYCCKEIAAWRAVGAGAEDGEMPGLVGEKVESVYDAGEEGLWMERERAELVGYFKGGQVVGEIAWRDEAAVV